MEYVRCNKCGAVYTDKGSIEMVKSWLDGPDPYAPCPKLDCKGQMEVFDPQQQAENED